MLECYVVNCILIYSVGNHGLSIKIKIPTYYYQCSFILVSIMSLTHPLYLHLLIVRVGFFVTGVWHEWGEGNSRPPAPPPSSCFALGLEWSLWRGRWQTSKECEVRTHSACGNDTEIWNAEFAYTGKQRHGLLSLGGSLWVWATFWFSQ